MSNSIVKTGVKSFSNPRKIGEALLNFFAPSVSYKVTYGVGGKELTLVSQREIDAEIEIEQAIGTEGARLTMRFYNISDARISKFKDLANNRTPIYVYLGTTGLVKKVGTFLIISDEHGLKIDRGLDDGVFTIYGLEIAAWITKFVSVSVTSVEGTAKGIISQIIEKVKDAIPELPDITVLDIGTLNTTYKFASEFKSLYEIFQDMKKQFNIYIQTRGNEIYLSKTITNITVTPLYLDGSAKGNAIEFRPFAEYETKNSLLTKDEEGIKVAISKAVTKRTGYRFTAKGDGDYRILNVVTAMNVRFGEIQLAPKTSLVITHLTHKYNSDNRPGSGYIIAGLLESQTTETSENSSRVSGDSFVALGQVLQEFADKKIKRNNEVLVGEAFSVKDAEHSSKNVLTVSTGMDTQEDTEGDGHWSRNLHVPSSDDQSERFMTAEDCSIISSYMGLGYGMFMPSSVDTIKQRAIMLKHQSSSDLLVAGYVLTNEMASDGANYPLHNAGDIYLMTRAGSRILMPTRIDADGTPESEIGGFSGAFKSMLLNVGSSLIAGNDRPDILDPNDLKMVQVGSLGTTQFYMKADGTMLIQDASGNKIELLTTGITITDKNGKIIAMTSSGVSITGNTSITGTGSTTGAFSAGGAISAGAGASGTMLASSPTGSITVTNGIVTAITP